MTRISTSKADIFLHGDNHIRMVIHDNAKLELSDILEINAAKLNLIGNKLHTVLLIPGAFSTITNEARIFSASEKINQNAIAKAILVFNASDRLIANFFIKINRPPAPTKLFASEHVAMKWLQEMAEVSAKRG